MLTARVAVRLMCAVKPLQRTWEILLMKWFLFTMQNGKRGKLRFLKAVSHGSTFFRMRATTCLRSMREFGSAVGRVPATASGLLLDGLLGWSTREVSTQTFSGSGLETLLNESPEPTGAALPGFYAQESFVAPWLRRSAVSSAIGSAQR
jgi:hypothetical protein